MILTHLDVQQAGTNSIFARSQACARTCRRSSPILIVYWQRSAPGWLGNGKQKPFPLRIRTAASEHGSYDQQAEAVTRSPNPISVAGSRLTTSLICSSMQTISEVYARARHSTCTLGKSGESSHTVDKKCTSRRRFADLLTAYGRVERSATTKSPTFDGRPTFGCAFSNALTGVLTNRVGGPT